MGAGVGRGTYKKGGCLKGEEERVREGERWGREGAGRGGAGHRGQPRHVSEVHGGGAAAAAAGGRHGAHGLEHQLGEAAAREGAAGGRQRRVVRPRSERGVRGGSELPKKLQARVQEPVEGAHHGEGGSGGREAVGM